MTLREWRSSSSRVRSKWFEQGQKNVGEVNPNPTDIDGGKWGRVRLQKWLCSTGLGPRRGDFPLGSKSESTFGLAVVLSGK
jgi:hypothetical protein